MSSTFEFRCSRCDTVTVLPDGGGDLNDGTCRPYCHPDDVLITRDDGEPLGSMNDQLEAPTPPRSDMDAWRAFDLAKPDSDHPANPWHRWDRERSRPKRSTTSRLPFSLSTTGYVRVPSKGSK